LNHEEADSLVQQLQYENSSLRKLLKVQTQHDCRKEVEEILKSEEILIRNKDNFFRSRSVQFHSSSNFNNAKREANITRRKGKNTQDTKGLIKDSIRKNRRKSRRKSRRKRSESFDFSIFAPQRLDESESSSEEDYKTYGFDGNYDKNLNTKHTIISSND